MLQLRLLLIGRVLRSYVQPLGTLSRLGVPVSVSGLCNVIKLPQGVTRCTTFVTLLLSEF